MVLAISIVLHRPDAARLARTLSSLALAVRVAGRTRPLNSEVYLTDHSPAAAPVESRAAWQACLGPGLPLRYDWMNANPGFGAGHNHAFRRAAGADVFLVANPDLEFVEDGIAAGLDFLAARADVGLLAPALVEPDGTLRPACFRYPDPLTLAARFVGGPWARRRSRRYECRDWDAALPVRSPPLASGCCMLFRSACYAELGGFDTRYFLYFEDFDLSWRAGRAGRSAYCPAMRVRHAGGGAGRKGWRHVVWFVAGAWRFFVTHGWRPAS